MIFCYKIPNRRARFIGIKIYCFHYKLANKGPNFSPFISWQNIASVFLPSPSCCNFWHNCQDQVNSAELEIVFHCETSWENCHYKIIIWEIPQRKIKNWETSNCKIKNWEISHCEIKHYEVSCFIFNCQALNSIHLSMQTEYLISRQFY